MIRLVLYMYVKYPLGTVTSTRCCDCIVRAVAERAPHALEGANCADGGGRRGDAGNWPGVWVHDRNRIEMAGSLRERPHGRLFRDRQSRRKGQIRDRRGPAYPGAARHGAAGRLRQLDRPAHRQGARRRSCSAGLAFPARRTRSISRAASRGASATTLSFAAKAAEIVGLYMAPPDNAIVLAVDESRPFRRSNAPKAISSCPTAAL